MTHPFVLALRRTWNAVPADLRRNFSLDLTASLLVGVYVAGVNTFVPVVARRMGAGPILLAFITAAPAAGNIISVLAAHYLQGRRKQPYMVAAWTLARAMFLFSPLLVAPLPFALVVVIHWLIISLPLTGYVEMMRQVYPDAYRGRAMAYVRVGFTACVTAFTPLAGWLLDVWGYIYLFPMAALVGMMGTFAFSRIRYAEVISRARHDMLAPWRLLITDARYRDYSLAFFTQGFGALMTAPLVPILLVDELHLNYSQVGILGMVNSVFWMVFYAVFGRTVDRRGGFWTVKVNFALMVFMPLAYFLAHNIWMVAVGYVFAGITMAGIDLGWMNAIMQFARREQISDYAALHAGLVGVRGIVAPLVGTALMSVPWIGLRGAFLVSFLLACLGWLLLQRVSVPERVEN